MGLRGKLLLGVLIVLTPLLLFLAYDYQRTQRQGTRTALDNQLRTAQSIAALVDASYDETISFAWSLTFDPIVKTMDSSNVSPYLAEHLPLHPYYENLAIYDANGNDRGSALPAPPGQPLINIADRAYFQQVMSTNAPAVSGILISRRTGHPVISLAVPLRDDHGQPIGVFVVALAVGYFPQQLEGVGLAPGQAIFLTDPTGRAAFHTLVPDLSWEERDFSSWLPLQQIFQNKFVLLDSFQSPLFNETRLAALISTSKYGWIVGVAIPRDTALAPAQATLQTWLLALLIVTSASVALALFIANLLVGPIKDLIAQAKALGQGELGRKVTIKTGDELEELGNSFNEMSAKLERTMSDLQAVLDSTENGIIMFGLDGKARFANQKLGQLLGVPHSNFMNCEWKQCLMMLSKKVEKPEELEKSMGNAFSKPETKLVDEIRVHNNNTERILRHFSGPVISNGGIIGRIEVFSDVTAERREERRREAIAETARALVEELQLEVVARKAAEQTARVFDADMVGLWLADTERRELSLLAVLNAPPEIEKIFERPSFDSGLTSARAAATGKPQIIEDVSIQEAEGSLGKQVMEHMGHRSLVSYPLKFRGHLVGVVSLAKKEPHPLGPGDQRTFAILSNIFAAAIENARLYEQVREALHLRDEFLSAAAHELRTPVTSLKGFSQLLLKEGGKHTDIERKALEAIDRQCNRISHLTQDLFMVSELQTGGIKLEKQLFDLRDVAKETVRGMQMVIDPERYKLVVKVGPDPVLVVSDSERTSEVFTNLIDAAIGRSPKGGVIEVEVFSHDREAVALVRDQGADIPKERFQHVFEPFYEPIPAGAIGYRGVVLLGPYVSRQLIERMGGRIWFKSEVGRGSIFYFSFPLAVKEDETEQAA